MKTLAQILCFLIYTCSGQEYTFPNDFQFGVGSSAYQVEGASKTNGKGVHIWDTLIQSNPGIIDDGSNADIACDSYHKTKEDVRLLKNLGVDFYRFSISWSRILPSGKTDYINPDGIRYYNELIDELLANDIKPFVTMFHFDLPQPLEDEGGFPNLKLADYFEDYANVLYENFGDRVKDWTTFNEPIVICHHGYGGIFNAPMTNNIESGYLCGRTLLIAHAKAYHLYNNTYKATQKGRIGIANLIFWYEPLSSKVEDVEATEAALEFYHGWFSHPIYTKDGDYPRIMKDRIAEASRKDGLERSRLPELTPAEIQMIKGTADYYGLIHYTTCYCRQMGEQTAGEPEAFLHFDDMRVSCLEDQSAESTVSPLLRAIPFGMRKSIKWLKDHYDNPEIVILENGFSNAGEIVLNDCRRINYHNSYLTELLKAVHEDGCNVSGYSAWSFIDNFEWTNGYRVRFGFHAVDFNGPNRTRIPKMSAHVYKKIIQDRKINWKYTPEGFPKCEWLKSKDEL